MNPKERREELIALLREVDHLSLATPESQKELLRRRIERTARFICLDLEEAEDKRGAIIGLQE